MNIYRIEVACASESNDSEGRGVQHDLRDFGLSGITAVRAVRVYTVAGEFSAADAVRAARELFADPVVDIFAVDDHVLPPSSGVGVEIMRKTGVMDPAEVSVKKGLKELGITAAWVRNSRKFIVAGQLTEAELAEATGKLLANDVIEQYQIGHDAKVNPPANTPYVFKRTEVSLAGLGDEELKTLSLKGQLYLSVPEMKAAQAYFQKLGRNPTDIELETVAQTWSEHCVHKTFKGVVKYRDAQTGQEEIIDNLLKNTVAKVTNEMKPDWCWSVFVDNSGVIEFDGEMGICFKVETHNHPSAIEPYGGAGTGIGGCIRDPMGTGLGGKPVFNTDVFCFGLPDLPRDKTPKGCLHPMRVMKGVISGVRDYGNRMGIPTGNGAVFFDHRYTGNPLVFCGNIALIPQDKAKKRRPSEGQLCIVVGGGTGRDGIHGATFSSVELDEDSEMVSSGAVQIGNPIEEKKVLDFLLRARDKGLYTCITDCGAGGLSSAIGEMGEEIGVEVDLAKVPLKYEGLSYTEIWISEAQERMVISADADKLAALQELAKEENVSITTIAKFGTGGKLILKYGSEKVGELDMEFLHEGCPRITREAVWTQPKFPEPAREVKMDFTDDLRKMLGAWNVCSKEWIIRQYDHEVQGGSVVKPLVGAAHDGPGDAAVIAPMLGSRKAAVVSNGLNPKFSDIDPYWMAASAIDEALRNIIAVGGTLDRCAILDNFCWGNCDKPDRLAGLVRAAKACYDFGKAFGVPFISGKDSLNNEYGVGSETICIPGTLLISAMAVIDDLGRAITMDAKTPGNAIYAVGMTFHELGASHYYALRNAIGNSVPQVRVELAKQVFAAMSEATGAKLLRSAHDASEGGLALAAGEMAFAGNLGIDISLKNLPRTGIEADDYAALLFSESNSRFVVEVKPENEAAFAAVMRRHNAPFARLGEVTEAKQFIVRAPYGQTLIDSDLASLKQAWQKPLAL